MTSFLMGLILFYVTIDFIFNVGANRSQTQGYHVVPEKMTFSDAKAYCVRTYGTELATLEDEWDNFKCRSLALGEGIQLSENLWIGLEANSNHDFETWSDGSKVGYTRWSEQDSSQGGSTNCVSISFEYGDYWEAESCLSKHYFVCNKVMKYHTINLQLNYTDAQKYCQKNGTHLASIHRSSEATSIRDQFGDYSFTIWIGMNDLEDEGVWTKYNDGSYLTSFAANSWRDNEPNDHGPGEDCGTIRHSVTQWNDNKCHRNFYFACNQIIEDGRCEILC